MYERLYRPVDDQEDNYYEYSSQENINENEEYQGSSSLNMSDEIQKPSPFQSVMRDRILATHNKNDKKYTIKKGETLESISSKFDLDENSLRRANAFDNEYEVKENQTIVLPGITDKKLEAIENTYRNIIKLAKLYGYSIAAGNLEKFLEGSGGEKIIPATWLKSFEVVNEAVITNRGRFEGAIMQKGDDMKEGQVITFSDHWDRLIYGAQSGSGGVPGELFYASGNSTLTSKGTFTLKKKNNEVTFNGKVIHKWHDEYNWNPGTFALIPGVGNIPDAYGNLMKEFKGAKEFKMSSEWKETVVGSDDLKSGGVNAIWK